MKIRLSRKLKQAASALLVTMVLGGILCLFVMYYLSLIQQQNVLSVRSQAWNIAIAVTEAGIEEGLQALNSSDTTAPAGAGTIWHFDGTLYWRTNNDASLGGNWYEVSINTGLRQITARSYVALPAMAANTPEVFLAVAAVPTPSANRFLVSRAVRVRYQKGGLYLAPLVAKHLIDLKGNGVLTDSFDSQSLWMSFFGQYDATKFTPGDKGDVASNDGVVSTISVQNANIYGKAHTGAEGTVTVGSQGAVGTHAWQAAGNKGFQEGYVLNDANFTFPEPSLPYSSGLPLGGPQTIVTVTYDYTQTPTNSTSYPNPPPWSGVTTNIVSYNTDTNRPSPPPLGLVTNTVWHTTTNTVSRATLWKPDDGTYVPPLVKSGPWYFYDHITGYTTWPSYTYTWPNFSYSYNLYGTNAISTTNTYDHVLTTGDYYTTADLSGKTIVTGEARLVLPNGLAMSGN